MSDSAILSETDQRLAEGKSQRRCIFGNERRL